MTSTELEQEVKIRLRENRDLSNMLLAVEVCLFRFNAQGDRISYNVMKQFKELVTSDKITPFSTIERTARKVREIARGEGDFSLIPSDELEKLRLELQEEFKEYSKSGKK